MKKLHIEKSSLLLVRINIFLWLMVGITLVIDEGFNHLIQDIIKTEIVGLVIVDEILLTDVHLVMIVGLLITIPVVFLLNKFYVRVMKDSIEIEG